MYSIIFTRHVHFFSKHVVWTTVFSTTTGKQIPTHKKNVKLDVVQMIKLCAAFQYFNNNNFIFFCNCLFYFANINEKRERKKWKDNRKWIKNYRRNLVVNCWLYLFAASFDEIKLFSISVRVRIWHVREEYDDWLIVKS